MSETFEQTIISVVIGAVLGFVASIGYPFVNHWFENRSLRGRLKQEFTMIRDEIKQGIEKNELEAKGFRRDYYQSHMKELPEVTDAKTWKAITEAEMAIHEIGNPVNIKEKYATALRLLNEVIKRL